MKIISREQFHRIKELYALGLSAPKIAALLGLHPETIRKWWKASEEEFEKAEIMKLGRAEPYRAYILELLRVQPNLRTGVIELRLKEAFPGYSVPKSILYHYMLKLREEAGYKLASQRRMSMRPELPPGYEAQVDFGQYKMRDMYDHVTTVYFFCMILSYSRMRFVYFSNRPFTTDKAIQAHNYAFRYFGGRTKTILYDQDRVFVVSENYGNILLVQDFEDYVRRVGFGVVLCRPSDPQTKGKVENFVKQVKESFLPGRLYTGIDSLNSAAIQWLDDTANQWCHAVKKKTPRELFKEESKELIKVPEYELGLEFRVVSLLHTISYESITYILPKEIFAPHQRIRIEERNGNLCFYSQSTGKKMFECAKGEKAGDVVLCANGQGLEKGTAELELRYMFNNDEIVNQFLNEIETINPRYRNAHYIRIRALCKVYTLDQIQEGMAQCLKMDRCTASALVAYLIYRYGERKKDERTSKYERRKCRELMEIIKEEIELGEFE